MISKFHKTNTNFQIAHFLAGACHTIDGAYFQLLELKEDRMDALAYADAQNKRHQAKRMRVEAWLNNEEADEASKLEAQADLDELDHMEAKGKILREACENEVAFYDHCLAVLEPLRVYKDLPLIEAHEATQYDEWKFELIKRAENALLTRGAVDSDDFAIMRLHPAFKDEILPRIKEVQSLMTLEDGKPNLQKQKLLEEQISESKFGLLE